MAETLVRETGSGRGREERSTMTVDLTQVALFDLDGSLADYEGAMRRDLALLRAPEEPEVGENFREMEQLPHIKARMDMIKRIPGWWENLAPIPGGLQVFQMAAEMGFSMNVLTKGPWNHP